MMSSKRPFGEDQEVQEEEPDEKRVRGDKKVLSNLRPEFLMKILRKSHIDDIEKMVNASPACKKVFEAHESEFPAPTFMSSVSPFMPSGSPSLTLRQVSDETGVISFNADVSIESLFRGVHKYENVSLEWIMRFMKKTKSVRFDRKDFVSSFFEERDLPRLKAFIRSECSDLENVRIDTHRDLDHIPLEQLLSLFEGLQITKGLSWSFLSDIGNLDNALSEISYIHVIGSISSRVMGEILKHKNMRTVILNSTEEFSLASIIEEWKRGERIIEHWSLYFDHYEDTRIETHISDNQEKELEIKFKQTVDLAWTWLNESPHYVRSHRNVHVSD